MVEAIHIDTAHALHIQYLLTYCEERRDCGKCEISEECGDLKENVAQRIKHMDDPNLTPFLILTEDDQGIILELIKYCGAWRPCKKCVKKVECLTLEGCILKERRKTKEVKTSDLCTL